MRSIVVLTFGLLIVGPGQASARARSAPTTTTWRASFGGQRLRLVQTEQPNRQSLYPRYHSRYTLHTPRGKQALSAEQGRRWGAVMNRALSRGAGTLTRRSPGRLVVSGHGRVLIHDLLGGRRSVSKKPAVGTAR